MSSSIIKTWYFPVTAVIFGLLPPSLRLLLASLQVSTKEAVFGSITFQRITTTIRTAQSTSYVSHCNLLQTLGPLIFPFFHRGAMDLSQEYLMCHDISIPPA